MTGNFLISSGAENNLPGNERPYFGWEAFFPEIIVGVSTADRGSGHAETFSQGLRNIDS